MRSCTLLNEMGDLTIAWEADKDAEMEQIIQRKMDQGVRFFVIKPFSKEEVQIKQLSELQSREITVKDEDVERLFTDGKVGLLKRFTSTAIDVISQVTTAREAAQNHTVGMRQFTGG